MKTRTFRDMITKLLIPFVVLPVALAIGQTTKYVLPLGNSITLGKSNSQLPAQNAGDYESHGYRGYLYQLVNTGIPDYTLEFTGPGDGYRGLTKDNYGVDPYRGWFKDGAVIADFLPSIDGSAAGELDVVAVLDELATLNRKPNYVTLHIGTNDIGGLGLLENTALIGHHDSPGTVMHDLKVLVKELLEWDSQYIEQVFLCKIIPRAPINEFPGVNANIQDFNRKIDDLFADFFQLNYNGKVTLVDMYSPFYAAQGVYYTADDQPGTSDDHVHPSLAGYEAMANQYADYLVDYLSKPLLEQFNLTDGIQLSSLPGGDDPQNNNKGWSATTTLMVSNPQGSVDGGLYCTAGDNAWNHIALWDSTQGLNSATIRIHGTSTYSQGVGVLVGMSSNDVTASPGGYMVFVHPENRAEVYVYDGRFANPIRSKVGEAPMTSLVAGDVLTVSYEKGTDKNAIFVSKNSGTGIPIVPSIQLLNSNTNYYCGLIFRGAVNNNLAVGSDLRLDYFRGENKRIDLIGPDEITLDLLAAATTNSTMTLNWTAVGDDGGADSQDPASSYDLRYSMHPIVSETDFENANIVGGLQPPQDPGTTETVVVKGLLSGVTYYYAIQVTDDYGNKSPISSAVSGTTTTERTSVEVFSNVDNWKVNTSEYGIDGATGDLVNRFDQSGADRWGGIAVYKAVRNPNLVKLVWGNSVTNPVRADGDDDNDELENGGIIMMASDTSLQAEAYFIFVRTRHQKVYLFETYWDQDTDSRKMRFLDATTYDYENVGAYPAAGDTLAVVADNSSDYYTKFDVYVGLNNDDIKSATRVSLYDTRDSAQRLGQNGSYYAGLLLSRYASTASRDNSVKAFITTSPQAEISGLQAMTATTGLSGTVNAELPDSIRVRVEDQNGLPVPGIPIFFDVSDGFGTISTPYTEDGRIRLEAEWGNPISPMISFDDNSASGDEYIASIQHGGTPRGYATYTFKVTQAGTYYFWGRVRNVAYPPTASRYVLGFELVGLDPVGGVTWEVLSDETISGDWQWDAVQQGSGQAPHSHLLTPGTYTFKIHTAHRDVWLDKLIVTNESPNIWRPTGAEVADVKLSDADGEAAVAWTLGTVADDLSTAGANEGLNRLDAWTFGSDAPLTFSVTGQAGAAASIVDDSVTLEGTSGDTLTMRVLVHDEFDNKKFNQGVTFAVTQGDGALLAGHDSRLTDEGGVATARIVLGAEDSVKVDAYYDANGPKVTMTAYVTQGNVSELISQTQNRNLHVDSTFTDYLRVLVRGNDGLPVATSMPVQFVVQDNIGSKVNGASSATVWTDVNGIAVANLETGSMAGIAHVNARTAGRTVVVAQDSVFYTAAHMSRPAGAGGQEVLAPGQLSHYPIKVYVADHPNWNPVKNFPVRFTITDTESGFTLESSGATTMVVNTNTLGFAEVKVRAGAFHGAESTFEDIVIATADNGFGQAIPSPQHFTFYVKSEAYRLNKMSLTPTDTTGVVGEMIGPLKVQLLKANGLPMAGQQIVFERKTGNGSFNPETKLAKKIVQADANGMASTNYWLGSFAGPDSNFIEVYSENYDLHISVSYNCLAQSSVGDTLYALSATSLTGVVGSLQSVKVKVVDQQNNPVEDELVRFAITQGSNAAVGSGTADQEQSISTNSKGEAVVAWTLGTTAGTSLNQLQASAHNGNYLLKGSPVTFTASTQADAVSLTRSELTATSPIMVGPSQNSEIIVTLRDKYGNPVPDQAVEICVIGGANNFPSKQTQASDDSGQAKGFLYSTSAGDRIIKAVVGGDTLSATAEVIFLAGNAAQLVEHAGNEQSGNINTVLQNAFEVRVTDGDGNPVQFGPVYFTASGNAGEVVEEQPIVTDADGFARAHFKMGSTVGRYAAVQVSNPNLSNKPTFWVTGTNKAAYSIWYAEGVETELEGAAGAPSPPMVVQVNDENGLPVAGEDVTFTVNVDEGSNGEIIGDRTVPSNEYGQASVQFKMDTRSGFESWVYAENASGSGKVWFKATSVSGTAVRMTAVGPTAITGQVIGTTVTLRVLTSDAYGNPISGETVTYHRLSGDADFIGASQVVTNSEGEAIMQVRLGTQAGTVRIQASSALEGSPIVYDIDSRTSEQNASTLLKLPEGVATLHGAVGRYLPDSLFARVVDDYNNPVANQPVLFRLLDTSHGGSISGDGREYTDSRGVAAVAFQCGASANFIHQVEARWGNKVVIFNVQTHTNSTSPVLDKDYISSVYSGIDEGTDLWIDLRATDADGDALTFEIGGVFPPDGAYIDPVPGDNRATFKWTPGFNQGRDDAYELRLRVVDGKGGFDEKPIKVFVQNLNQLPNIDATTPNTNDIQAVSGQTVVFEVYASDPDGDPLVYTWKIDGVPVSNNSAVYHHITPVTDSDLTQIVDVEVSDGAFSVSYRWTLTTTSAVSLAQFAANVMESDGSVRLMWKTTVETHHAGFNVLRSQSQNGQYVQVNDMLLHPAEDGQYIFEDHDVFAGQTYYYKLADVDMAGNSREHGPMQVHVAAPEHFALMQNYPNPFNPTTTIRYQLAEPGPVKLVIYNMMGQVVRELIDTAMPAGFFTVEWDGLDRHGRQTATGLYLYRLEAGDKVKVKRMIKLH